ncbi:potassium/proton antiporter [Halobacillus amylolyticus]|uniref:Potassium/proton antiporter n=1 Tax=Halobacillus amylolyticus TaxID=2932259 RepID=A0ABY4H9C3_9BACI|nr:potassium/proton antiporter [Halobacillus amylolyticus]UOR11146.1 potassium/proton antiporter [Halobacillus amylolyticus]
MDFSVESIILLLSIMLLTGVLTTKFSIRLGMPSLILFLVAGMLLNNYIYFENAKLAQLIGIFALIIILFDGGTQTKWKDIKPIAGAASSLATAGVLITSFVTGAAAVYIFGLSWLEGLLLGAIVGSTDAAAVFSVLGNKNIKKKITSTLEAESGTNDPMAVFLTIIFIDLIQIPETSVWEAIGSFFVEMGLGLIAGLLLGKLTVFVVNKIDLDSSGLYPVLALSFAIFTYAFTATIGGSGLLAVYIMAVFVGNSDLMYRFAILRFNEGFGWMMQILMFMMLGLLSFPSQLLGVAWKGILLSIILMFIARPIGVFISTLGMNYNLKEKTFISWAGLKGAVPIVLATYPLIDNVENSDLIFNAVFFVVIISALVQGSTLSWVGSRLKLAGDPKNRSIGELELINLGKTETEIIEVTLGEDSPITGRELNDIDFPKETIIVTIARGDEVITPTGDSIMQAYDTVYVLTQKKKRKEVRKLLTVKGQETAKKNN